MNIVRKTANIIIRMFDIDKAEIESEVQWTLEEGITFCRSIEPFLCASGFHCAITGSTLFQGASTKDLDIIVYPHKWNQEKPHGKEIETAINCLRAFFMLEFTELDHTDYGDDKVVWMAFHNNKRVDLFFLK